MPSDAKSRLLMRSDNTKLSRNDRGGLELFSVTETIRRLASLEVRLHFSYQSVKVRLRYDRGDSRGSGSD